MFLFFDHEEVIDVALEIQGEACFDWFHGGESLKFVGGLVKKKVALVLRLINLLGKPSALLENAWPENRLAAADEEGSECVQEFHGCSVLVFC
jgi:hypothetical protein